MLILRIKQAEVALADGRLDEAFELAMAQDVREHRRGQDLAGQIARALVKRGQEHLKADRLSQAGSDCEKASKLAGNTPDIAGLRAAVVGTLMDRQQAQQAEADALRLAGQHIDRGQLSVGQQVLDGIKEGNGKAAALLQDVNARRMAIEHAVERAAAALKRSDWETAVEELVSAKSNGAGDVRLQELIGRLSGMLMQKINEAVETGRLDMAGLLLERQTRLADRTVESEQVARVLEQCRAAADAIDGGHLRRAEQIMKRLSTVLPKAEWIEEAVKSLAQAAAATEELKCGPLGMLDRDSGLGTRVSDRELARPESRDPRPDANSLPASQVPQKFLIQVDGVGSFLVLRQAKVRVGPVSSSVMPDVGLVVDAQTPAVEIERIEEDYFLRGGEAGRGRLLASGEKIALTPRCRLSFRLPSAASTTAILDLHSARLPRADVRQVILMDREMILGPGGSAHMRADEMADPVTLFVRDGQLFCQGKGEIMINDRPAQRSAAIPMGCHVRAGAVTFVVTPA